MENEQERNELLGIRGKQACASFSGASLETLDKLLAMGELDLYETKNDAPSIGAIMEFMRQFPEVTAHGYVIGAGRSDYRVSLEGVEYEGKVSKKLMREFVAMFRQADEFQCEYTGLYCWYD